MFEFEGKIELWVLSWTISWSGLRVLWDRKQSVFSCKNLRKDIYQDVKSQPSTHCTHNSVELPACTFMYILAERIGLPYLSYVHDFTTKTRCPTTDTLCSPLSHESMWLWSFLFRSLDNKPPLVKCCLLIPHLSATFVLLVFWISSVHFFLLRRFHLVHHQAGSVGRNLDRGQNSFLATEEKLYSCTD